MIAPPPFLRWLLGLDGGDVDSVSSALTSDVATAGNADGWRLVIHIH